MPASPVPTSAAQDPYGPDSRYALLRMGVSLLISTILGAGMWAVVVALPAVQAEFGVDRAAASLPYTFLMVGLAIGSIVLGRVMDRTGIAVLLVFAALSLGAGFVIAGLAPNIAVFTAAHALLIGLCAGTGFAPMVADISHWFVRRRGLAVSVVASGNYLAGTLWPLVMKWSMPVFGWRATYVGMGIVIAALVVPLAALMRRRPSTRMLAEAEAATARARADVGVSSRLLVAMLAVAGFACCVAMSMPQVHIVAYCGDLGYGVARGAEMLSLMLFLGIVSRIASGIVCDRIGAVQTLLIGSLMQGASLLLYTVVNGLTSLYVVSGIFGLFQGGIVPMYAVICRQLLPPREAGEKIGIVLAATILGMAFGGYASGLIYDWTSSYRLAFIHGVAWNGLNLAVVLWLLLRARPTSRAPVLQRA
ncbi:MAG: MFS transporter [Alsobacter sp.]